MWGIHLSFSKMKMALFVVILFGLTLSVFGTLNIVKAQEQGSVNGTAASPTQETAPGLTLQEQEPSEQITLTSGIEPNLNENFVWSGLISSNIDGLPSPDEDEHSAVILPLRDDGGLYSGILTYQSNSPVDVTVWNQVSENETSVVDDLGDDLGVIEGLGVIDGVTVAPIEIGSGTSGSVLFTGSALELIGDDEDAFIATYAINATVGLPRTVDDLSGIGSFATDDEVVDEEGDEEE